MDKKVVDSFTVLNSKGLHLRPAAQLIKCIVGFQDPTVVTLACRGTVVNGKSFLDILSLEAAKGEIITIEATGDHAQEIVHSVLHLAKNQFHVK